MRRDMIVALDLKIEVRNEELQIELCALTASDEAEINSNVWHTKGEVGRLEIEPIKIEITNPEISKYCRTGMTILCIFGREERP